MIFNDFFRGGDLKSNLLHHPLPFKMDLAVVLIKKNVVLCVL